MRLLCACRRMCCTRVAFIGGKRRRPRHLPPLTVMWVVAAVAPGDVNRLDRGTRAPAHNRTHRWSAGPSVRVRRANRRVYVCVCIRPIHTHALYVQDGVYTGRSVSQDAPDIVFSKTARVNGFSKRLFNMFCYSRVYINNII